VYKLLIFTFLLSASGNSLANLITLDFQGEVTTVNDPTNILNSIDLLGKLFSGRLAYDDSYINTGHVDGEDIISKVTIGDFTFDTPTDSSFIDQALSGTFIAILPYNPIIFTDSSPIAFTYAGDSSISFNQEGYGTWSLNIFAPNYDYLFSITGEVNSVKPSASVPEPSTLTIFALGMIGLVSRRFKKH
jgi:hypothetical protein